MRRVDENIIRFLSICLCVVCIIATWTSAYFLSQATTWYGCILPVIGWAVFGLIGLIAGGIAICWR